MRRLGEKLGTRLDAERSAIRCHSDEEYSGNGIRFRRSTRRSAVKLNQQEKGGGWAK